MEAAQKVLDYLKVKVVMKDDTHFCMSLGEVIEEGEGEEDNASKLSRSAVCLPKVSPC